MTNSTLCPCRNANGLCAQCLVKVGTSLRALPGLYTQCEEALASSTPGLGFMIRVSGSNTKGISLDPRIMEARRAIERVLSSWARLVADERGIRPPPAEGFKVPQLTRFLLVHLSWIAEHPAAPDFAREIHDLVSTARSSYHAVGDLMRVHSHECVVPGCPGTLMSGAGEAGGEPEIRCDAGHAWTVRQWLLLSRQLNAVDASSPRRTVSTRDAAIALGVGQGTIRQWARRGKLTRYGSGCRAEYDLDELTALAEARSLREDARPRKGCQTQRSQR